MQPPRWQTRLPGAPLSEEGERRREAAKAPPSPWPGSPAEERRRREPPAQLPPARYREGDAGELRVSPTGNR